YSPESVTPSRVTIFLAQNAEHRAAPLFIDFFGASQIMVRYALSSFLLGSGLVSFGFRSGYVPELGAESVF
ncbi:MAG TPA: hypothetical protein P5038_19370, partial [Candidatus Paceibacterota bacterium]|nr:hypothetical protein [Candidatus Paceibacterota bacterium]